MAPESDLERLLLVQTRQLEDATESLRRREQIHATELEKLQQIATHLTTHQPIDSLYEQILDSVLTIVHADLASIQKFHPHLGTNGELELLGHRGFSAQAAERWA